MKMAIEDCKGGTHFPAKLNFFLPRFEGKVSLNVRAKRFGYLDQAQCRQRRKP